ncbi:radical SAM protein [Flaviaesturariibacter flavus]|uniref:Radical SAM protein n=1 Tax=Flaviaesturariibacter flavus TaxID=2502780 RepID=A0A4R1B9W7_9BACT|nr:B12-binding domain-containing radical SAM protein [Flaviaesturariibacter flavus]TCJ13731.1 radical SAM protein [Flaviaesturariibacter flavus]
MQTPVFLITPPFTQLNTPYPATAYLKGFLNTRGIASVQADLGIEVTLALFCRQGLERLFAAIDARQGEWSANAARMLTLRDDYLDTIDEVVAFLQGHRPTLAQRISRRDFLPEASRFAALDDLQWAFGSMGQQDRAKHLATLYLEDLGDLVKETVDEHFGFSRYAERLGRCAHSFDELYAALRQEYTFIDQLLVEILEQRIAAVNPQLVALSVPFPGNLYTSLRCAQWIRKHYPDVRIAMGGGFANTELRSISDPRVFEFYHFITLDDGEAPVEQLLAHVQGKVPLEGLKRTFTLLNGVVTFIDNSACSDYRQGQVGTPDYSDLPLERYISAIEVVNPMHSLWSDGRWNKLTMAHGCYWGKCTFCDISLDYIKNYEPLTASLLADRMEELIAQTGQNGFHFVDEAAPPALMKALALEIIRRRLVVSWWANVRFEKSFTRDLCLLLKASGCIAVSGGLEVASDRLLGLIQKGITVAQVARVCRHFSEAGIMVHAYLMYGFPTQTEQETIDSLELVRQLFASGVLQSAFWHLFTMTAHSPVGLDPAKYKVRKRTEAIGTFANNDIDHDDPIGGDHERFGFGLRKALHNYMHGACFDFPLQKWFDFKVPRTTVAPDTIARALEEPALSAGNPRVVFLGRQPAATTVQRSKKGVQWEVLALNFETRTTTHPAQVEPEKGRWLLGLLPRITPGAPPMTLQQVKADYEAAGLEDFELFWDNKPVNSLHKAGLLRV